MTSEAWRTKRLEEAEEARKRDIEEAAQREAKRMRDEMAFEAKMRNPFFVGFSDMEEVLLLVIARAIVRRDPGRFF